MKKIFTLITALTLSVGLWAINEDADAPENFSAEVVGTSYGSVTIKAYAEDDSGDIIYIVKESGVVIATANGISGVEKNITVTGLASGTDYLLLVLAADPTGNETEGLSLRATTLATPASPEAPTYAEQNVISIFSDSYSAATSFNVGSWGQSTVSEEVRLADNGKAYFLSNADYLGWELATTIDVTNMKYVRFDVYPLNGAGTAIEFTPNWGGEKLLKQEGLVAGAWNTVTFSIEDFSGIVKDNINQLIWSNMPTEMFITNVLFYTDAPYLFVDGKVTINELKDSENIYFQYFTYVDGKRVNGINGSTIRKNTFEPYTTEGYCEINYTNKDDVERNFIVNPKIENAVDSIYQGETYLFADTLLTTAGTYQRTIESNTMTLTLKVKQKPVKYTTYENWQLKHEGSGWEWTENMIKVEEGLFKLEVNWTGSGFYVKSDENPIKKDWYAVDDPDVHIAEEVHAPVTVDVYLRVIDDEHLKIGIGEAPPVPASGPTVDETGITVNGRKYGFPVRLVKEVK